MICVHDFTRSEVLVKVGVMEFGLNHTQLQQITEFWIPHVNSLKKINPTPA